MVLPQFGGGLSCAEVEELARIPTQYRCRAKFCACASVAKNIGPDVVYGQLEAAGRSCCCMGSPLIGTVYRALVPPAL